MKFTTEELEKMIDIIDTFMPQEDKKHFLKKFRQAYRKKSKFPDYEEWIEINNYKEKRDNAFNNKDGVCDGYCNSCLRDDYTHESIRHDEEVELYLKDRTLEDKYWTLENGAAYLIQEALRANNLKTSITHRQDFIGGGIELGVNIWKKEK